MSKSEIISKEEFLTKDQFKAALPVEARMRVTDTMLDHINQIITEPELRHDFKESILGYANVVATGRFKLQTYIDAVRFVSYKLLGASAVQAYARTFPERYQRLVDEGADNNTISAYSTAFNKTVIVNKIFEQTLIPTHILNADIFQKAINKQAFLMAHAKSEKVQSDAADSLMKHLKAPETQRVELNVNTADDKSIQELRDVTAQLASRQKAMIESGVMNSKEIAHSKILSADSH